MMQLNQSFLSSLQNQMSKETIHQFIRKYNCEQENQNKKMNTPATNCTNTSWRKQTGNAIQKIRKRRKNILQKEEQKKAESPNKNEYNERQDQMQPLGNNSNMEMTKFLIKNKAIFFGQDCELPYLHSSDALSHMYAKKMKENEKEEILFNPASSIDRSYMTGLRSLHIYHTSIESLRQLGTGWCQLKELSIIYGKLSDLSGLSSFSSLQYLYLSFNKIISLSDLMFHPSLKYVDLQRNKIESIQEIQYLTTMDKIESINLNYNPIMKIKEKKRIIQQKLGKLLQLEEYTRVIDYQLEDLAKDHDVLSYQNMEVSNYLVKTCNELLNQDDITLQNLYESYEMGQNHEERNKNLDFLRYQTKVQEEVIPQTEEIIELEEQEVIFTPLIHFLSGKKIYTSVLKKYLENKIFLNIKKKQNGQKSPSIRENTFHSGLRLNKFISSTKLQKEEDLFNLQKGQSLSKEVNSLGKTKLNRLSLGKTRKLLQKCDKSPNTASIASKFTHHLSSTVGPNLKSFPLKRSILSKKPTQVDLQVDIQKKFSQTATVSYQE